jgi:hypothetical protein
MTSIDPVVDARLDALFDEWAIGMPSFADSPAEIQKLCRLFWKGGYVAASKEFVGKLLQALTKGENHAESNQSTNSHNA